MSDADEDVLVMSEVDAEIPEKQNESNYAKDETSVEIMNETHTPDEGWEVVDRRKTNRKEQIFKNDNSGDKLNNKTELSILDKLSLHLRDEKVVPVDHDKANKSLQYLRNQWQNWTFGRVIRIQGMYFFFFRVYT